MMRVLEVTAALDGGGVDKLLYDFCSRIMEYDKSVHFDFVVTSETEGILEEPLTRMGCNIIHIHQMSGNIINYLKDLVNIIKKGKYQIIHDHMNQASMGSMLAAIYCKVPVRIAHCHTYIHTERVSRKLKRHIMAFVSRVCATDLWACSEISAKWMWGKNKSVYIMKNAISLNLFHFSQDKRNSIRKELHIEDALVVGNVARFSEEKNHEFMLYVIKELKKHIKTKLILIGRGPIEEKIKEKVMQVGLEDTVDFLGIRSDVAELLNAMDVFILPSLYEGFPVTLVEAQANGVPVIVSDVVTKECLLSENIVYKKVNDGPKSWAKECVRLKNCRLSDLNEKIMDYDVDNEAEKTWHYYYRLIEQRGKRYE